jgi:hypothetical protein
MGAPCCPSRVVAYITDRKQNRGYVFGSSIVVSRDDPESSHMQKSSRFNSDAAWRGAFALQLPRPGAGPPPA